MMLILAVAAVLVGIVGLFRSEYRRRKGTEKPKRARRIGTITIWRRSAFLGALACAGEYRDALNDVHVLDHQSNQNASVRELTVWAASALLTSAAAISRYSQGKANLWVVSAVSCDGNNAVVSIRIRSLSFVGPFPIWQLREGDGRFRDMHVRTDSRPETAIGAAAYADALQLADLSNDQSVSDRERELGTTHVLAIPICDKLHNVNSGTVVGITVDLSIPRTLAWLYRRHHLRPFRRLTTRAQEVQEVGRAISAPLKDVAERS
jgi:hypothetical protein